MGFLDRDGACELPFHKDIIFGAINQAIPTIAGMRVANADAMLGRIVVSAGVSLFSWGESIPVQLYEIEGGRTKIQITSSSKTGIGALIDMGKNRKNIEDILAATSRVLQVAEAGNNLDVLGNYSNWAQTNTTPRTSKMAIASLACFGLGIIPIILGHIAIPLKIFKKSLLSVVLSKLLGKF